jgi:RNA-directed DNA polymerase
LQDPIATTEDSNSDLPEAFAVNDKGLPRKVFALRQGLYRKAKREPEFRFYSLYGQILRPDVLRWAWERVASNDGSPGVDGMSIQAVRNSPTGVDGFLAEIFEALKTRTYRPQAVKRVYIEKDNGKLRPLGIPTVRDRVVQAAVMLLLEPIFEADFLECSMGFRPRRSAHQALEEVRENLRQGRTAIYDADLASYFDTIPHENLIKCVEKRVADRSVLTLIRMWLKAIVVEDDDAGGKGGRKVSRPKQGTPQGGVISPLLANLYLHWFDKMFHRSDGPFQWANARMVRYADDFVILAKFVGWRIEGFVSSVLEGRMKLSINRSKTRTVKLSDPGESLDFLGYTFRYDRDLYGGEKRYLNVFPSMKSLQKERNKLREMTGPSRCFLPVVTLIAQVNMNLRGWGAYFGRGYPAKAFRQINSFALQRLTWHLQRRSQRPFHPPKGTSWYAQLHRLGLVPLRGSVSRQ